MRPNNRIDRVKRQFLVFLTIGTTIACTIPAFGQLSSTHPNTSKAGIHLQLDKTVYGRGETVWFNAYLFNQEGISVGSTLQVELIKSDSVITSVLYPVVLGVTNGQLPISKEISTGWYQIRAFTEQAAIPAFNSHVYIIGKDLPELNRDRLQKNSATISFNPESGILIAGLETLVVFKATDGMGNPVKVSGRIRDQKGNEITTFSTWERGMGEFVFTPDINNQYNAEWSFNGEIKQQSLPLVQQYGTSLSLINHPEGFLFDIKRKGDDPQKKGVWLAGSMNNQEVFRQPLSKDQSLIQGVLKTKNLTSGILIIRVLDEEGSMLVSRKVFVNNEEDRFPIDIRTDTLSATAKAKNKWWLQLPDSLQGTISIGVTDAEMDGGVYRHSSIRSKALLGPVISAAIFEPDWYFQTTKDSADIGLDLLMLTLGEDRSLTDSSSSLTLSTNRKGFITVKGKAFLRGTRQPLTNSRIMAILAVNRMRNQIFFTETDRDGKFTIDSLLFFGNARIFFAEQRTKKNPRFIDIQLDEDSIPLIHPSASLKNDHSRYLPSELTASNPKWIRDYEDIIQKAEGLTLEEITIKSRSKSVLQKLQEEYTTGAFDTDAFVERVIDLVNNDEASSYPNIFEYLRFRIPGLQVMEPDYSRPPPDLGTSGGFDVRNDPTKYRIFFRQMPSASSMGNIPMVIYLNEIETDADLLLTIPAAEIALVKIFSSFTAAPGGGPGGALAIYTKKPELLRQSSGSAVTFTGYSSNSPFPTPNYEVDLTARNKPDGRVTLDWRPNIFLTGDRKQIPIRFYNNDRTKRFRVRVEGLTSTGSPIFFEKIVE